MNKILREEMEYLIHCDDKAITPDVKDDVEMTLDYIDELENKIDKAIEYIDTLYINEYDGNSYYIKDNTGNDELGIEDIPNNIKNILRGEDNE